jgi:hypothetical protein
MMSTPARTSFHPSGMGRPSLEDAPGRNIVFVKNSFPRDLSNEE